MNAPPARRLLILLLLALAVLVCFLPFSNKAFHIDDPLFLWTAQHIAQHPLDPYGFSVVWYATETPIVEVTKNPPLAAYYAAAAGRIFGWSERALHLAFLLPALIVVLGTYLLAERFTRLAWLAALLTLFAPGFIVSGTGVMCDVLMLAFWMLAVLFWLRGEEAGNPAWLFLAVLCAAASALTKYFGVAVLPLLAAFSLLRHRRWRNSLLWLALPALLLALYQYATLRRYGRGLFSDALLYASLHNRGHELGAAAKFILGLSFSGGCAFFILLFAPLAWRWRGLALAAGAGAIAAALVCRGIISVDAPQAAANRASFCLQLAFFAFGGALLLALACGAWWRQRSEPLVTLLVLWLLGTFVFAAFLNWTMNARSILPLIPSAAILLAKRLGDRLDSASHLALPRIALPLALTAAAGAWAACADFQLANAGRTAAETLSQQTRVTGAGVFFQGHWGFQYYMQRAGAVPADKRKTLFRSGDILLVPENTTNSFGPPDGFVFADAQILNFPVAGRLATMSQPRGAGFYASVWGPLPFAIGEVPPERYLVARLRAVSDSPPNLRP